MKALIPGETALLVETAPRSTGMRTLDPLPTVRIDTEFQWGSNKGEANRWMIFQRISSDSKESSR